MSNALVVNSDTPGPGSARAKAAGLAVALGLWALAYSQLHRLSDWVAFGLLPLPRGSALGEAAAFFLYEAPKVLLLLVLVVFAVGVLRTFFTQERARRLR